MLWNVLQRQKIAQLSLGESPKRKEILGKVACQRWTNMFSNSLFPTSMILQSRTIDESWGRNFSTLVTQSSKCGGSDLVGLRIGATVQAQIPYNRCLTQPRINNCKDSVLKATDRAIWPCGPDRKAVGNDTAIIVRRWGINWAFERRCWKSLVDRTDCTEKSSSILRDICDEAHCGLADNAEF